MARSLSNPDHFWTKIGISYQALTFDDLATDDICLFCGHRQGRHEEMRLLGTSGLWRKIGPDQALGFVLKPYQQDGIIGQSAYIEPTTTICVPPGILVIKLDLFQPWD